MRMLGLVGAYKSDGKKLKSGVSYSTQPTDIPYNALAYEDGCVYEFVRVSGTCTVGALVYLTGTAMNYVVCTGTGAGKPRGIALVAPTASGVWTWILRDGKCTSVQTTSTFGGSAAAASSLIFGGESAAQNFSAAYTSVYSFGGATPIGRSLTEATGSQTIGYIQLL